MLSQLLRLNAFRGEPTSSGMEWHFTPNHNSSAGPSALVGSDLHLVSSKQPSSWIDHLGLQWLLPYEEALSLWLRWVTNPGCWGEIAQIQWAMGIHHITWGVPKINSTWINSFWLVNHHHSNPKIEWSYRNLMTIDPNWMSDCQRWEAIGQSRFSRLISICSGLHNMVEFGRCDSHLAALVKWNMSQERFTQDQPCQNGEEAVQSV